MYNKHFFSNELNFQMFEELLARDQQFSYFQLRDLPCAIQRMA